MEADESISLEEQIKEIIEGCIFQCLTNDTNGRIIIIRHVKERLHDMNPNRISDGIDKCALQSRLSNVLGIGNIFNEVGLER